MTAIHKIQEALKQAEIAAHELNARATVDEEAKELILKIWQVVWCEKCYDANSQKSYDTANQIYEPVKRLVDKYELSR